jgi:molybdopterin/thiamine biosynthesis adenylyltransferase
LGKPLINAAAQDFDGLAHRIDPSQQDMCLICRVGEKARTEDTHVRCQDEEGDVPVQSIATTSAVTASIQTVLLLLSLAGRDPQAFNWVGFDGRRNWLEGVQSQPRWPDECPAHLLTDVGPGAAPLEAGAVGY